MGSTIKKFYRISLNPLSSHYLMKEVDRYQAIQGYLDQFHLVLEAIKSSLLDIFVFLMTNQLLSLTSCNLHLLIILKNFLLQLSQRDGEALSLTLSH